MVTAVAVWSIWGSDTFPEQKDPTGSKWMVDALTVLPVQAVADND